MCKFFPIHCTILKHFVNATTWDLTDQLAARSHNGRGGILRPFLNRKGAVPDPATRTPGRPADGRDRDRNRNLLSFPGSGAPSSDSFFGVTIALRQQFSYAELWNCSLTPSSRGF
jgi:hypothetical protein